jgi:hypothetical protein
LSSDDDALNNNPIAKVVEDAGIVATVLMKTHRPHVDIQDQYQLHVMLRQLLLVKILFAVPKSQQQQQQQQQQWLGETTTTTTTTTTVVGGNEFEIETNRCVLSNCRSRPDGFVHGFLRREWK